MEQTPIEKAIAEFNGLKAKAKSLRDVIYLDGVLAVLDSILPYEKKRDRKIAENAWDECFDSFLQHTPEFNGSIEDIEKDKQTYLN